MDDFFGIGFGEILLILVVAVILLGPERMVELGRMLGRAKQTLKKASTEITEQVNREIREEKADASQPPRRDS